MKKTLKVLGTACLLALTASAGAGLLPASVSAQEIYTAPSPPPPPQYEPPPPVRVGWVWAPGHWRWNGFRYIWIGGHWVPQRVGWHWIPAHWAPGGPGGWHYVDGHWAR